MTINKQLFANNAATTLAIPLLPGDVQLVVVDGSRFPVPDQSLGQYFKVTVEADGEFEIIEISGVSGNTLTVRGGTSGRGKEGTIAETFIPGSVVECRVTRDTVADLHPTSAYLPRTDNVDLLPIPPETTSVAFYAGVDDYNQVVFVYTLDDLLWNIPSYKEVASGTTISLGATSAVLVGATIEASPPSGRFIIQFTSGAQRGQCRILTSFTSGSDLATWSTGLNGTITGEVTYTVYQSYSSILDTFSGLVLGAYAPLNNPAFTGTPSTAATPNPGDNSLNLATTEYVDRIFANFDDTIWVPATAMWTRQTNGAEFTTTNIGTNGMTYKAFSFDAAISEGVQFTIRMPRGWNEGAFKAYFVWTSAAGTGPVVWGLRAISLSNAEALTTAFSSPVLASSQNGIANQLSQTTITGNLPLSGISENDLVVFEIYRDVANAGDTLAADARLIGATLIYTRNTLSD